MGDKGQYSPVKTKSGTINTSFFAQVVWPLNCIDPLGGEGFQIMRFSKSKEWIFNQINSFILKSEKVIRQ